MKFYLRLLNSLDARDRQGVFLGFMLTIFLFSGFFIGFGLRGLM